MPEPIPGYDLYKLDNGPYEDERGIHPPDCDCEACDEREHPEEIWTDWMPLLRGLPGVAAEDDREEDR